MTVDTRRIRKLNDIAISTGPVVYWMSRDQRASDNWALLYAQETALEYKQPLAVVFTLAPSFLGATIRQYSFMLKGLEQVEASLKKKNIPFLLLSGDPVEQLPRFIKKHNPGAIITDFSPLKIHRKWKYSVAKDSHIAVSEVDAHNIIPCWETSNKQEFAARTIRPKIHRKLPEFLTEFPKLKKHPIDWPEKMPSTDWTKARKSLKVDTSISPIDWLQPGENAAHKILDIFINTKLAAYANDRNDPNRFALSNLSPYYHFGHIAPQRAALEVQAADNQTGGTEAYLEEMIVRRELSDNYCLYNPDYDSVAGFPEWAKKTLDDHRSDPREFLYSPEMFENAETHDYLWNAAQREMMTTGKMHGYMRMYWAKKILEWTPSPEEAMEIAGYLNDRYELDGRDPNGYVGVAWSIGGVHDRPWFERDIFGKIRYMNANGCRRKFDVEAYTATHSG